MHCVLAMQIRLYFPETGHPAYGILRALVKDSTNIANAPSHTDSDGRVGFTYDRGSLNSKPFNRQFLADGLWHMATLTTLGNNTRGYALLLDGNLVGLQTPAIFYTGEQVCCIALSLHCCKHISAAAGMVADNAHLP